MKNLLSFALNNQRRYLPSMVAIYDYLSIFLREDIVLNYDFELFENSLEVLEYMDITIILEELASIRKNKLTSNSKKVLQILEKTEPEIWLIEHILNILDNAFLLKLYNDNYLGSEAQTIKSLVLKEMNKRNLQ